MANKLPTIVQFLLADAARQEAGGKITLLGLYSGDMVLLNGKLPKKLPDGQKVLGLPSLTILATVIDGRGKFHSSFQIYDPNGKPFGTGAPQEIEIKAEGPFNYILALTPFPIPAFGLYRVDLIIDKKKFTYKFTVRHIDQKAKFPLPGKPLDHGVIAKDNNGLLSLKVKGKRLLRAGGAKRRGTVMVS